MGINLRNPEIANEQYNNREVKHYYDHDGCLVIKARLPVEQGALIVKALEMAIDASFVGAPHVGAGLARDTDVPAGTSEPIAARRADGLAEIAETYMNNNESSGSTADRYQVIVHVTASNVGAPLGRDSYIEDGPNVPAGQVPLG